MTPNDDTQDQDLLARYRRASEADAAGPSEAVRAAILAESRRVAEGLAKQAPPRAVDVSRPAANDSRWKIPAFGTLGAALLAALLFAPRYWENAPPAQVNTASRPPVLAPAQKEPMQTAPTQTEEGAGAPKLAEMKPYAKESNAVTARQAPSESNSLQEIIVTQADRKSSKSYDKPALQPRSDLSTPPQRREADAGVQPGAAADRGALADKSESTNAAPAAPPMSPPAAGGAPRAGAPRAAQISSAVAPVPAVLLSAAESGDVAQTASLLDRGAAIDVRDGLGRTPLMRAVMQGRSEVVRLLLDRGADPNVADNSGNTPLQQARRQDSREIAALFEEWERARRRAQ